MVPVDTEEGVVAVAARGTEAATRVVTRVAGRAVAEMVRGIQEEEVKVRVVMDMAAVVVVCPDNAVVGPDKAAVGPGGSRGWVVERSVVVRLVETKDTAVTESVATAPEDPDEGAAEVTVPENRVVEVAEATVPENRGTAAAAVTARGTGEGGGSGPAPKEVGGGEAEVGWTEASTDRKN